MTMKPDERRAMRRQQIEQFLASDMGVMEWTKLNRMSTSTFYLWLHRFQDEDPETFGHREPKGGAWIELSRAELRDSVALAKAGDPAPTAPVVAANTPNPAPAPGRRPVIGPAIRISLNGAGVEVPAGAAEADIAAVLRAVASL
ncbi:MAG: IS66 family insertion sequence element accessory protein TnpA [Coriobacteriales bacterium]